MQIKETSLPDVWLIEPSVFSDDRGYFLEIYQTKKFAASGIPYTFVQDNLAGSHKGVLRGLHYQIRNTQGKLVQLLFGEIFDVIVDLRRSSAMFGKWMGMSLAAESNAQLWIPPGFAHGYYVISAWARVVYKVTDYYSPEWERTLLWNDPGIGIEWPLLNGDIPRLSAKDRQGKLLQESETFE